MHSSCFLRRIALVLFATIQIVSCKQAAVSVVKDEAVPTGATGGGGNCSQAQEVRGKEVGPDISGDPLGAPPTITEKNPPSDAPSATECDAPNAEGPKVRDFKKNDLYKETSSGGNGLRLDDTPPPAENEGQTNGGASTGTASNGSGPGSSSGPGSGSDATAGDACDTGKKVDTKILYGNNAGTLPACGDANFTAWLKDLAKKEAQRTGKSSDFADKLEAPKAPTDKQRSSTFEMPPDTREAYENGVYMLLSDISTIKSANGSGLAGADPMSLLSDVDATFHELPPPGESTDPKDGDVLGYNTEIDQLADNFAQLENMESLFSAGPSSGSQDGLALNNNLPGGSNESKGGDLKSWVVGEGRFKLGFSAGFGAQYGADNNFGRGGSDPDLRPTGGEPVDDNTRSMKDQREPFKTEKFKGLSIGGGPAVDVTVFGKEFKNVLKGYVKGQAFGSDVTKNGIELGFQVFGATLWKKNYLNCNKPKPGEAANGCKEPEAAQPTNKLQQKLAWLGRTARGIYNFTVGPVPMDAEWTAAPFVGYSWNIGLDMDVKGLSAKVVAGFYPRGKAQVSLAGGFSFIGQRAGVGGRLVLLNIGPSGQIGATAAIETAGFRFCPFVKATLDSEFLAGNLFAYAQVWYIFGSKYWELNLYSWKGIVDSKPLFEIAPENCKNLAPKADEIADTSPKAQLVQLKSVYNSDWCIDQRTDDRSVAYMFKCHGGRNQKFTFEPSQSDAKAGQIVAEDGKCLDVDKSSNAKIDGGIRAYFYDCHRGDNQTFRLRDNGTITDGWKAYCLDFHINRGNGGGYVLYSHPCHNDKNQQWRLVP